jgi:hypothetical protein
MTQEQVLELLKEKQGDRSLREFALEVGCSAAYLSDVYNGNREPAKKILDYLGLTRTRTVKIVTVYK